MYIRKQRVIILILFFWIMAAMPLKAVERLIFSTFPKSGQALV
jgi:hypothetical protein